MSEDDHKERDIRLAQEAEKLFSRPWDFVTSVADMSGLPDADRPEVAFAGRSNVGKSSLINALVGQKNLARTSNTPGRTQLLNFFQTQAADFYLVDMPGYGYASAPKAVIDNWTMLVNDYLRGRPTLTRVFVLIDARHGLKANDRKVMEALDTTAVPYQIVLTKADKIKAAAFEKLQNTIETELIKFPAALPTLLLTSSEKGLGLTDLRVELAKLAGI